MKEIMTRAWEIAKQGQSKFGGKVSEYISEALKKAWFEYRSEKEENTSAKMEVVLAKLRKNQKFTIATLIEQSHELEFNEVMHKAGAYYGIEVIADGDTTTTVYVSERIWEAA
ncbi:hypothetical protein Javan237_0003 [Streptococcus phage Javan237]|uniref:hypothetical protein n=1 Tax=Streptococcus gallolyticus TaxID=315405 RepID=UPI0008813820|nr:hypothetical protein [Streptococcus gallolyticus]QBX16201.1 hypothetical protein Javan237_0003 [Streptococcus phage Javan237]QBX25075.1 hypothetical protein Javan238_0003 [Streptococcus phage Javan238]SDJ73927.1 bacteriophage Gp111 protein [Streptococcus gallolyticus]SDL24330.1 bacteriophage Gp111 protein [Streptococcus gallolyticus]